MSRTTTTAMTAATAFGLTLVALTATLAASGCSDGPPAIDAGADGDADAGAEVGGGGGDGGGAGGAVGGDGSGDASADASVDDVAPQGSPDGGADGAHAEDGQVAEVTASLCASFCTRFNALACPADDPSSCVAQCESVVAAPPCGQAYGQLVACGADRPASDFHCDGDSAALADTVCVDQAQAFADCLLFGP